MRLASVVAAVAAALAAVPVRAGYITVGMSEPRQCNSSVVEWYGDDGPYHLLLTPTTFVSHGYNVWIPSIPNGTTSYNLSIGQPAGMQFMVTVWGASGIEYAGTTDVLTVLPSLTNDKSCFLSDAAISGLYSFAFNMSNTNRMFPPQCSNLTMSWPTSLESEIPLERRGRLVDRGELDLMADTSSLADDEDTSSSNKTSGNTTVPPTMFGIIPLGNSFSIPITYKKGSKAAKGLPASSVSDNPTTTTIKGVTYLDWTINLAKGTRFILVAGIGSKEEWASGGSSEMMTVGQGSSDCLYGDNTPKVTATNSQGPIVRPTASSAPEDVPPKTETNSKSLVAIVVASVFSVLGTLLAIGVLWLCCRIRRKRGRATKEGRPKPSVLNIASFGRLDRKHGSKRVSTREGAETQLDLISGFDDASEYATTPPSTASRRPPHIVTSPRRPVSAVTSLSPSDSDRYRDTPERPYVHMNHGSIGSSRPSTLYDRPSTLYDDAPYAPRAVTMYEEVYPPRPMTMFDGDQPSPRRVATMFEDGAYPYPYGYMPQPSSPLASPVRRDASLDRMSELRQDFIGRQSSIDGFVSYPLMAHGGIPSAPQPLPETPTGPRTRRPLVIHDPSTLDSDDESSANLADLKRETLAVLDSHPNSPVTAGGSGMPIAGPGPSSSAPRRRRQQPRDDEVTEFLVHRDAGRIAGDGPGPHVLELPPRYEELDWANDIQADPAIIARISTPPPVTSSPAASPHSPLPTPPTAPAHPPLPTPPPRSSTLSSNPHPLPIPPVRPPESRQTTM